MLTKTKFKDPNLFITEQVFYDVYDSLKDYKLSDCAELLWKLGMAHNRVTLPSGKMVDIEDLMVLHGDPLANDVGPIYFYAGPEIDTDSSAESDRFTVTGGSVLSWTVDSVLYKVSCCGVSILLALGIYT